MEDEVKGPKVPNAEGAGNTTPTQRRSNRSRLAAVLGASRPPESCSRSRAAESQTNLFAGQQIRPNDDIKKVDGGTGFGKKLG